MRGRKTSKWILITAIVVVAAIGIYRVGHNKGKAKVEVERGNELEEIVGVGQRNDFDPPSLPPSPPPSPTTTPTLSSNSTPPSTSRGTSVYTVVDSKDKVHTAFKESEDIRIVGLVGRAKAIVEVSEKGKAILEANPRLTFEGVPAKTLADVPLRAGELTVVPLRTEDLELIERVVKANKGEVLERCGTLSSPDIRIRATEETIEALMALPEARWIENYARPVFFNYASARKMKVNDCWPSEAGDDCGTVGLNLTGAGQLLTTTDSGIDTANMESMTPDIAPNLIGFDYTYDERYVSRTDINGHGTHTAGSIVGTGANSEGKYKGMAYEAKLWAWMGGDAEGGSGSYVPYTVDEAFRPTNQSSYKDCGMVSYIYSASYGSTYNNKGADIHSLYTTSSQDIDEYCWYHPDFLPCWAAGNDGTSGLSTQGASKNALVVGATNGDGIAYFSSRGPTLDGRTKPDVCAPGWNIISVRSSQASSSQGYNQYYAYMSGTSQATPLTAGTCALLRQWLVEKKGFKLPSSALMKAVLMGGATDLNAAKTAQGAGRTCLRSSIAPEDGRAVYLKDYLPFIEGQKTVITFTTKSAAPLDAQLVWVDYPGTVDEDQSKSKLMNDLDLVLYDDKGEWLAYGNGGDKPDRLNNAEAIHQASLPQGTYKLFVNAENVPYNSTKGGAAAIYLKGDFDLQSVVAEQQWHQACKIIVR